MAHIAHLLVTLERVSQVNKAIAFTVKLSHAILIQFSNFHCSTAALALFEHYTCYIAPFKYMQGSVLVRNNLLELSVGTYCLGKSVTEEKQPLTKVENGFLEFQPNELSIRVIIHFLLPYVPVSSTYHIPSRKTLVYSHISSRVINSIAKHMYTITVYRYRNYLTNKKIQT